MGIPSLTTFTTDSSLSYGELLCHRTVYMMDMDDARGRGQKDHPGFFNGNSYFSYEMLVH